MVVLTRLLHRVWLNPIHILWQEIGMTGDNLFVASLGNSPLTSEVLSSTAAMLRTGRYMPVSLMSRQPATVFEIGPERRMQGYQPLSTIAPLEACVFVISR